MSEIQITRESISTRHKHGCNFDTAYVILPLDFDDFEPDRPKRYANNSLVIGGVRINSADGHPKLTWDEHFPEEKYNHLTLASLGGASLVKAIYDRREQFQFVETPGIKAAWRRARLMWQERYPGKAGQTKALQLLRASGLEVTDLPTQPSTFRL